MESLRLLQRRAVQELLRELSLQNNRQILFHRQQVSNFNGLKSASKPARRPFSTLQTNQYTRSVTRQKPYHNQQQTPFSLSFRRGNIPRSRQRTVRHSSSTTQAQPPPSPEPNTLSARLRKLSREYGWSALGIYLLLSALDFPFCFLAVRTLGTERIGHWEHVLLQWLKESVKWPLEKLGWQASADGLGEGGMVVKSGVRQGAEMIEGDDGAKRLLQQDQEEQGGWEDHGVKKAEEANRGDGASLWTQLALAYAIHKSFIFIRVPITAAVTPKVVKTLRSWGWNIGKRPTKGVKEAVGGPAAGKGKGVGIEVEKGTGVNITGKK